MLPRAGNKLYLLLVLILFLGSVSSVLSPDTASNNKTVSSIEFIVDTVDIEASPRPNSAIDMDATTISASKTSADLNEEVTITAFFDNDPGIDGLSFSLRENGVVLCSKILDGGTTDVCIVYRTKTSAQSVTYTAHQGGASVDSVVVTWSQINDPPVANDDTAVTNEDTVVDIDVLANDYDEESTPQIINPGNPSHGNTVIVSGRIRYTPSPNYFGEDTFTYIIRDSNGVTDSADVVVTIVPVNDLPVANPDSFSVVEDTPTNLDVLSNDFDQESATLQITGILQAPSHGSANVINDAGVFKIRYIPTTNYNGGDSLQYRISDGTGGFHQTTVSITVTPVNDAPVAVDDTFNIIEDSTFNGDVSLNDNDVDSSVTFQLISAPASSSSFSFATDGKFTFVPTQDSTTTQQFVYQISDGSLTDLGVVTLNIIAINDAPTAVDDSTSVNEDGSVLITVLGNDFDVDGDVVTVVNVTIAPTHGSVVVHANGTITYTPDADYSGTDSFTYLITDGTGFYDAALVSIDINGVNDAPIAVDDTYSVDEDKSLVGDVSGNDTDIDSAVLSYTVLSNPSSSSSFVLYSNGTFVYTPQTNFNGEDVFSYTVTDGNLSDTGTVTITVNPQNDAPQAADDTASVSEDGFVTIDVLGNDNDLDGDIIAVDSIISNPAHGSVVINTNGTITYTPDADYSGTDSFAYRINDGNGETSDAVVDITVNPQNDAPVALDDRYSTDEDVSFRGNVSLNDTDIDSASLTYSIETTTTNGQLTLYSNGTFDYIPDANYTGTDSFEYQISDGLLTDTALVTITVVPVNDAPQAADDSYTVNEDTVLQGDVSINDSDIDSGSLTYSLTGDVSHGTLTFNSDGSFDYTPDGNYTGSDSFTYQVSDGFLTDTAIVTITVSEVNDVPIALDDDVSVNEDTQITIDVLSNDSDIDGDTLSVTLIVVGPVHGVVVLNVDDTITYIPNSNYFGDDSFTYRISDGNGQTADAIVSITVNPINDAPNAGDNSYVVTEDTVLTGDISTIVNDIDSPVLTFTVFTDVAQGSLVLNSDGSFIYSPNLNYVGLDQFTYQISDGSLTDTGVVTILIIEVNDAPIASDDQFSTDEDTPLNGDVSNNDTDSDSPLLTYSLLSDVSHGTLTFNNDGSFGYTPDSNYFGSDSFTYQVSDGTLSDTATVVLTIDAVNDGPIANDDNYLVSEDNQLVGDVSVNDVDIDSASLTFVLVTDVANGELVFNSDGSFDYSPDTDFVGSDTFTYRITDGDLSDLAVVTIDIGAVNDAPVAVDDYFTTNEDTSISEDVSNNDYDVDSASLTYSLVSTVTSGSLIFNSDGTFDYTPNTDFVGIDSFTYQVTDGLLSDAGMVTIDVGDVNDAPQAVDDSYTINEDTVLNGDVSINDIDPDSSSLSYSLISTVNNGVLNLLADGTFNYTPDLNFVGSDSFTYRVTDGLLSDTGIVSISVEAVNDAPVAGDDFFSGDEDTTLTGDVSTNDTDIDSATLTFTLLTGPSELVFNSDGTFELTPDLDFFGVITFTYSVSDGLLSDTATVTLRIIGVNDNPVANDDSFIGDEDSTLNGDVSLNDEDTDGDNLSVSLIDGVNSGSLSLDSNGTFIYTPESDFFGVVTFTYRLSDGVAFDTATVTLTISNVNDAPEAQSDSYETDEDTNLIVGNTNGLLANDDDIDGDSLSVILQTSPSNGVLTLAADGSFSYLPNTGFVGVDTFTYKATDGSLDSDVVTVTIRVIEVADTTTSTDPTTTTQSSTPATDSSETSDGTATTDEGPTSSDDPTLPVNWITIILGLVSVVTFTRRDRGRF